MVLTGPVPYRRLRLRRQGGADQQMRRRSDARADGDHKLGDGRNDRGDRPRNWGSIRSRCAGLICCARRSALHHADRRVADDIAPARTLEAALDELRRRVVPCPTGSGPQPAASIAAWASAAVVESTTYGSAFYKAAGIPGSGHEAAWVKVEPSGAVDASVGLMGSGQGYETTLAQAVARGSAWLPRTCACTLGNTDTAPYGMGSRGARGGTAGGGAVAGAAQALQRQGAAPSPPSCWG